MAGSFTDYTENGVLDTVFGQKTTFSTASHSTWYWGLSTGTITDASKSSAVPGEVVGTGYARKAQANSSASWANSSGGIKLLKSAVVVSTNANADWGVVTSIFIATTASGAGDVVVWSSLTGGAKTINTGDTVTITTGFSITLT